MVTILYRINDNRCLSTLLNINDSLDKTTKSRIENVKICLARRLARLTPSQVATLFALHPGKHAGFHGIVKITTNSRFHVRNPRTVASSSVVPPCSPRVVRSTGHPRRAAHWNSNVNLEKVRAHIAERERDQEESQRGRGKRLRNECGVLLVSLRDVENGRRIAPMFVLEFCSVDEDLKLQGCVSVSSIGVVL